MMTLWTGFKQQHSALDETIGPNEETHTHTHTKRFQSKLCNNDDNDMLLY